MTDTELTTSTGIQDPVSRMLTLLEKGGDVEVMKKMMELCETWRANQAKQEYIMALNECQAEMPPVVKDAHNEQTSSMYAKLESVNTVIKPCYTKHGFSISFYEGVTTKEDHVRIVADVLHTGGHERQYFVDLHIDGKGIKGNVNMIPIHAKASTFSYGQRYLICMIFNVTIAGQDIDGNQGPQGLTDDQVEAINGLLERVRARFGDEAQYEAFLVTWWKWLKCPHGLVDLKAGRYEEAVLDLKQRLGKK
jgi:hypothetical protein